MPGFLIAFAASLVATLLIIRYEHLHAHLSSDADLKGPQKFHTKAVPRIGGMGIFLGITVAILYRYQNSPNPALELTLLACALPAFGAGLVEDLTKKVGVKTRLLFTGLSGAMAVYFLGALITKLDITGLDWLMAIPIVSVFFTIFCVMGLSNAYNIIDGFHGLASMVGMISLVAIAYVNFLVGDLLFFSLSFVMIGACLGFFVRNYPRGLIFLGDGGSYMIGFWIAILSIMLVARHSNVSPWFALLVNAYPIFETLFTIYRRKLHQNKSPGQPDAIHIHSLIYRRVLKARNINKSPDQFSANAKTSPYLWILSGLPVIASILWWQSSAKLIICVIFFMFLYIWLYRRIVHFRTPHWLHLLY
ncbi:MraY family glycosyltransferase [Polynucleobacter paneuropaeus]|uniref:MraY family glycosyltransferase n=1 Tax=Polynucleobacter paneuropaeus TaxID=2527775 RepID=UPI001BFD585D|nr:glycosyltransferase [Polynucleobacter paneuropaeus]MBT8621891.1 glycosyl transferase [Polynucleobacter paneuropaeus]